MKRIVYLVAFVLVLSAFPVLHAQSGAGSFSFTLNGYTVQGQLINAIIHPDNSVALTMNINGNLQTPVGSVPITGNGEWTGKADGTILSGTIKNVQGTVRICLPLSSCGNANYVGQGTWNGNLSGQQGTGKFQGTITFTSSPVPQVPVNQPTPVSGTWNSNFQLTS
jgi:hypothetical protein